MNNQKKVLLMSLLNVLEEKVHFHSQLPEEQLLYSFSPTCCINALTSCLLPTLLIVFFSDQNADFIIWLKLYPSYLRSFPLAILTKKQHILDLLSIYIHTTEQGRMLTVSMYYELHLFISICTFSFNLPSYTMKIIIFKPTIERRDGVRNVNKSIHRFWPETVLVWTRNGTSHAKTCNVTFTKGKAPKKRHPCGKKMCVYKLFLNWRYLLKERTCSWLKFSSKFEKSF